MNPLDAVRQRRRKMPRVNYPFGSVWLVPIKDEPRDRRQLDTPERAAGYWREVVEAEPGHNPDVENMVVMALDTRRRVMWHHRVSQGTMDTLLVHPREVFRSLIVGAASAFIMLHNHPSGDAAPSEADIKVTRDFIRAGQLLKIEMLDHVVVGRAGTCSPGDKGWSSLRELGYFYI